MVNYMWNLCMPKLEYSHKKFWIQLTSGKGDCVLQRSSGCVVSNTCNAQLKIVLNNWQVRSQNSECYPKPRDTVCFCQHMSCSTNNSESWLYIQIIYIPAAKTLVQRGSSLLIFLLCQRSFLLSLWNFCTCPTAKQMLWVGLLLSNPCLEHNTQLPAKLLPFS